MFFSIDNYDCAKSVHRNISLTESIEYGESDDEVIDMLSKQSRGIITIGTILIIGFLMPLFIPEEVADGRAPTGSITLEASFSFSEFSDLGSDDVTTLNKVRILAPLIVGLLLILAGAILSEIPRAIVVFLSGTGLFVASYAIGNHPVLELDVLQRFTFWLGMLSLALVHAGNEDAPCRGITKWIGLIGGILFILYSTLPFFNQVQPGISIFRIPYQIIAEKSVVSMVFGYGLILVIAGWAFASVMTGLNLMDGSLMKPSSIRHIVLIVWAWFFLLALFANYVPLIGALSGISSGKLFTLVSVAWNFIKTAIFIFTPFYVFTTGIRLVLQMKRI